MCVSMYDVLLGTGSVTMRINFHIKSQAHSPISMPSPLLSIILDYSIISPPPPPPHTHTQFLSHMIDSPRPLYVDWIL